MTMSRRKLSTLSCIPEDDRAAVETWHRAEVSRAFAQGVNMSTNAQIGLLILLVLLFLGGIGDIVSYEKLPACLPPKEKEAPAWEDVTPDRSPSELEKLVVGNTTCWRLTIGEKRASLCEEAK